MTQSEEDAHYLDICDAPQFPPERHDCPAEDSQDGRDGHNAAGDDKTIHEPANNQFPNVNECRSVQNLPDRMEVLVLWVFDEPQCTGAQTCAECSEKDGELIPKAVVSECCSRD
jgi:hypothetical protein